MSAPTTAVTAYFDLVDSDTVFILDDPVKGLLDGATYTLAGNVATDISNYVRVSTITRGRERALDEVQTGVAQLTANNQDRTFDPEYASSPFVGNIIPGKRMTVAANGITIFDGLVDDWNFDYPVSTDSTASFDVVDCLATLASAEFDEWTSTASQTVGQRLTSILDRNEVRFPSTRNIEAGTSTLQADLVTWGSNVLNYCQLVAKCDLGLLFAAKDGTLTFYGRNRSVTGVGAPIFSDVAADVAAGTAIPYSAIVLDYGTELLFNRVSVDATGFTKQTVQDDTSALIFGGGVNAKYYSLSLSNLPLETQQQALDLATYLLNLYSNPQDRIASITVDLHGLTTDNQNLCLNLDIGSVVRVVYTPNGVGSAIDKFCMVEGIDHELLPGEHTMTLRLSNLADGFSGQVFVLDDTTWGLLDTGGVLAF